MSRDRIDWANLSPLPRRKKERADVEAHAERKFHRNKAKHKGRPHFYAHQRREREEADKDAASRTIAKRDSLARKFKDAVRRYWKGESDEHP